jgi:haloalkane dehalogenase
MNISRHFVDIGPRRVHYRRCGSGPALLMVHQSPRSSAEYEALMRVWGEHFTCIAPDTPGFGQSDPLPEGETSIDAFADAIVDLIDALGLNRVGAYGFHSGGIILVAALRRHPERFTCLAVGGYAIWTPEEMALFSDKYLPPFQPSAFGEHLVWLWNRVLEQSWFFPWFATDPRYALSLAHDDLRRVDAVVQELLDAGDAYRVGYGAVLRAPRDIPPPSAVTPPVLITAYDGDPLQVHLDRLGTMPVGWSAHAVTTPAEHQSASLAFLRQHPAAAVTTLGESGEEGYVTIDTGAFAGLIHWRGLISETVMTIHGPGRAAALVQGFAIDLPGHGLSDRWPGPAPTDWEPWRGVIEAVGEHFGITSVRHEPLPVGDPERIFPDLAPDRFGTYLTRAWSIIRAGHFFSPWYEANADHALAFDTAAIDPGRLALEHRALLQASAARELMTARNTATGDDYGNP